MQLPETQLSFAFTDDIPVYLTENRDANSRQVSISGRIITDQDKKGLVGTSTTDDSGITLWHVSAGTILCY
jgi:hypothetical protein